MSSSTSLPESANAWNASAKSALEPVTVAATNFATAIARLAASATTTVRVLSVATRAPMPRAARCPSDPADKHTRQRRGPACAALALCQRAVLDQRIQLLHHQLRHRRM